MHVSAQPIVQALWMLAGPCPQEARFGVGGCILIGQEGGICQPDGMGTLKL